MKYGWHDQSLIGDECAIFGGQIAVILEAEIHIQDVVRIERSGVLGDHERTDN
jgi:hypothetical protein